MKGFLVKKTTAKVNFLLERQGKKEKKKTKNRRKITEIKARERLVYRKKKGKSIFFFFNSPYEAKC